MRSGEIAQPRANKHLRREGVGSISISKKDENRDTVETTSPSGVVSTPAMPECDGNVLEPRLWMSFVAVASTSDIYRVSKAFSEVLEEYPEVKVVFSRTSLSRLWIVDGKPDE